MIRVMRKHNLANKKKATNTNEGGEGGTVHWIQDNFVFGQNSKFLLVFRNGPVRSIGIFYATFEQSDEET